MKVHPIIKECKLGSQAPNNNEGTRFGGVVTV